MRSFVDGLISALILLIAVIVSIFLLWPLISTLVTIGLLGLVLALWAARREVRRNRESGETHE